MEKNSMGIDIEVYYIYYSIDLEQKVGQNWVNLKYSNFRSENKNSLTF